MRLGAVGTGGVPGGWAGCRTREALRAARFVAPGAEVGVLRAAGGVAPVARGAGWAGWAAGEAVRAAGGVERGAGFAGAGAARR